jgi:integrase
MASSWVLPRGHLAPSVAAFRFSDSPDDFVGPGCVEHGEDFRPVGDAARSVAELGCAGETLDRLHDLRHGCVSVLIALGVPPRTVMDIVGHSTLEMTMTVYGQVSLDDKRARSARRSAR